MMLMRLRNKQRGFSLLEALLAIVIILAAGLGVVELFISADKRNKLQSTEQIAQQVASATSQLISGSYDVADKVTEADVIASGLLPQSVIVTSNGDSSIMGPYGTFIVLSDEKTREKFTVTANGLPKDQAVGFCHDMYANFAILVNNTALTSIGACSTSTFSGSVTLGYPRAAYTTTTA